MEKFSIPGVGGIIERRINDIDHILVQCRCKDDTLSEYGLIEIPAGKIREFENIYDCLRREVFEETGLTIEKIKDEEKSEIFENGDYKVLNYIPFSCSQNIDGKYPIMVQVFICSAKGEVVEESNESKGLEWITLSTLSNLLENDKSKLYPMHVQTLEYYIQYKSIGSLSTTHHLKEVGL